ncbi:hypothetical protein CEXT_536541 [Caerostris extrusa]|uniref:Uncharacterized protein n=1 Tax=Caerostris extrusa TaxID=172846 RepID=A0AAV4TUM9_CAEEX|nr:hypothetical protein CEXT_536541 [Caerostris extrusa]
MEMIKSDLEDKGQWVSSSSDIKSSNMQCSGLKHNQEQIILDDTNYMPMNDIECKLNAQMEVSSSKLDNIRTSGLCGDESSPDECLVIDCDNEEKWSSPCLETNIVLNVLDDKLDKSEMSPSTFTLNQSSLMKSPAQILTSSNHSLPRPLSYAIDDDLMNEAVMPIEK